jgi:hypothetical protein
MRPHFTGNAIAVDMVGPSRLVFGLHKSVGLAPALSRAREDEWRAEGRQGEEEGVREEEEKGEGEWWRRYECYEFAPQTPTQVVKGVLWGRQRLTYKGQITISCSRTGFVAHLRFCEEVCRGFHSTVLECIGH